MLQALTQSGTGVLPELTPIPPALLVALQEEGEWGVGSHTGKGKAVTRRRGDAEVEGDFENCGRDEVPLVPISISGTLWTCKGWGASLRLRVES